MKAERSSVLKIKLKDNDAENFKSAMNKIANDQSAGFNRTGLTDDEIKVVKDLSDKI